MRSSYAPPTPLVGIGSLAITLIFGLVGTAHAQDRPTCAVDVAPRVAREIDVGALEDAIASELGVEVVPSDVPEAAMHVRLSPQGTGRVTVTLLLADGRTRRRVARLDPDRAERVQTLAIVITNLARNEADELLAQLRRSREEEAVSDLDSTAESTSTSESTSDSESTAESTSTSESTSTAESTSESNPDPGPETDSTPADPADSVAAEPPAGPPPPPSPPHDPVLRIGLDAQLGSVPDGSGGLGLAWLAGLEIAWTPLPLFALGVRDVGGGYSRSGRWSVGGALVAELAWRFADWGDLHAQLGVHAQFIKADSAAAARGDAVGIAPLLVVGARLFAVSFFSVSLETALRYAATDTFHVGTELVPQGAFVWTGGLSIAFHVL